MPGDIGALHFKAVILAGVTEELCHATNERDGHILICQERRKTVTFNTTRVLDIISLTDHRIISADNFYAKHVINKSRGRPDRFLYP